MSASAWMVAARSPEETPVVVPARASTDTVKAVRCDSLLLATICGSSRRASRSSSMGTQMMPLPWRIMKATASGVASSAAMMRSPSFSRSSSSMTRTMRPALRSATMSSTESRLGAAAGGTDLPERGRTLDIGTPRGKCPDYTYAVSAPLVLMPLTLLQQGQYGLRQGLLGNSGRPLGLQLCADHSPCIDHVGDRDRDRISEAIDACLARQRRRVAELPHDLLNAGRIRSLIDAEPEKIEAARVIAPVEPVEGRHLAAAGRAPGGPDVHQDHLAVQLREVELVTIELRHDELRSRL